MGHGQNWEWTAELNESRACILGPSYSILNMLGSCWANLCWFNILNVFQQSCRRQVMEGKQWKQLSLLECHSNAHDKACLHHCSGDGGKRTWEEGTDVGSLRITEDQHYWWDTERRQDERTWDESQVSDLGGWWLVKFRQKNRFGGLPWWSSG